MIYIDVFCRKKDVLNRTPFFRTPERTLFAFSLCENKRFARSSPREHQSAELIHFYVRVLLDFNNKTTLDRVVLLYKENHALDAWFNKAYGGE